MSATWNLIYHVITAQGGQLLLIHHTHGTTSVTSVPSAPASGLDTVRRPFLIGATTDAAIVFDPVSHAVTTTRQLATDAYPIYSYPAPDGQHLWFVNDGDAQGNDPINCPQGGSSVIVMRRQGQDAELVKIICAGRGHHMIAFTHPTPTRPDIKALAFISNLEDGSLHIVGNDPAETGSYLNVLNLLNLADPVKEPNGNGSIPNTAAPHGMMFSALTGAVYNLNNGYQTLIAIDPQTQAIDGKIALPYSSNLLLTPCGRYAIGKGVDRKSDPAHVIGKLSVVDLIEGRVVSSLDLPDIYPSTYRFSPDGRVLFVTTASTGKGTQKTNLRHALVLAFDAGKLPQWELIKEIPVGVADCARRPFVFAGRDAQYRVFFPNPTDGTITVVDGATLTVSATVTLNHAPATEVNFSFWDGAVHGC